MDQWYEVKWKSPIKIFRTLSDGHNWNSKKIKTLRQKWSDEPRKTNGNQINLPFRLLLDLVRTTGCLSICSQILQERSSNWPTAQALHLLSPQSQAHPFKQWTQRMSGEQRRSEKKDGKAWTLQRQLNFVNKRFSSKTRSLLLLVLVFWILFYGKFICFFLLLLSQSLLRLVLFSLPPLWGFVWNWVLLNSIFGLINRKKVQLRGKPGKRSPVFPKIPSRFAGNYRIAVSPVSSDAVDSESQRLSCLNETLRISKMRIR